MIAAQRFIPVGHRGAPRELPPNTMAGFRRAAAIGCSMVECDVRRSRDGVLVLAHEDRVTDRAGGDFEITETDAAVLAALDLGVGEGVPTLEELAAWSVTAQVAIMADMKVSGDGVEAETAHLLRGLDRGQKVVPGADLDARRRFRTTDDTLTLSLSLGVDSLPDRSFQQILAERNALEIDAVTFQWRLLTADRVQALKDAGLRVFAWTVDDDSVMEQLAGWGVDGIISNRADLAVQVASKVFE